jgi:Subtilase family
VSLQMLAVAMATAVAGALAVAIPTWAVRGTPVTALPGMLRGRAIVPAPAALERSAIPVRAGAAAPAPAAPSDPGFAGCESQDPVKGCTDNEQWDLFGPLAGNTCLAPGGSLADRPHPDAGLPCWALNATDPQHSAGVDMTGAWAQGNVGRNDVLVAYIEGGVNYRNDGIKDSLDNIYLNKGELPYPENADGRSAGRYDANREGRFDIRDYARDPRVNPSCPPGVAPFFKHQEGVTWGCVTGGQHAYIDAVDVAGQRTPYLSPEDLIAVFGHCRIVRGIVRACPPGGRFDNDHNGYANDISGWNFDRNTNDPQTDEPDYSHAPGLISLVGGEANNGFAGVGVCRQCRVVPIKQGAEAVGRTDRWAESILYATDLGATAISSVVVEYSYSSFSQRAVDYANRHGVLVALDSNDFDSMDHTDGMLFDHAIPGNSLAEDQSPPATATFRARSNTTSYGTHNLFSTEETSTSGATPFMASVLAMTQSAALDARDRHMIPDRLTPIEVKQVLMDTASPVIPQVQFPGVAHQWPGNPRSATDATHTNWSTQYGYGRPDVGAATRLIMSGRVPPTAELDYPHWFQYVDPVRQRWLPVRGLLARSRWRSGGSVSWTLEWALGANPPDAAFHTIAAATTRARAGLLGRFDLRRIPASYYERAPTATLPPDGPEQYTVTLRLRVRDSNGLKAEDRRTIGVRHDPDLLPGYPRAVGGELAAAPSYVDLEGRHQLDLVFATYDGRLHALRPDGREVPGFPVSSDLERQIDPLNPENYSARSYRDPALRDVHEPLTGIAVGDLFHDGRLEIVATSANANVYAWNAHGLRLRGFPRHSDPRYWSLPVPTPQAPTPHGRLPARGNWSPPVLADLEGNGRLDILMTAYDGFVYAFRANGRPLPGWPVEVKLPPADFARFGVNPQTYIRDSKLVYPVGVADVLGTGRPQVYVSSFECNGSSKAWLYGIWPDGNRHAGGPYLSNWPVAVPTLSRCYDQSIDFVGEGTSAPVFGPVDGRLRIFTSGISGPVEVLNGDGSVFATMSSACTSADCGPLAPYRPGDALTVTLTGQGALGDLRNTGTPQYLQSTTGAESLSAALGVAGQAALPQTYEEAWNPSNGSVVAGFPRRQDGFPFYTAPLAADIGDDGTEQVIESNDSSWIHAFALTGGEAPGFPKYTGQWPSFSGVVGDPEMNGRMRLAYGTREGYLFLWRVHGAVRMQGAWPHYRHDERNTGLYGLDTLRPEGILDLRGGRGPGLTLTWTAPGGDHQLGSAARYDIRMARTPITETSFWHARSLPGAPRPAQAGTRQKVVLPAPRAGVTYIAIRAIDAAGNTSALSDVVRILRH